MMDIDWIEVEGEPPFPTWVAKLGNYTFVITNEGGSFVASAKPLGGTMNDGTRLDMGHYETLFVAKHACWMLSRATETVQ